MLEIALAGVAFALTAPLIRVIQTQLLGWWPQTWTIRLGTDGQYGRSALLLTAVLLLLGTVIVAPVVEELYFRGFLLPRMPQRLGPWRVPAHAALFAGYHVWSPWLIPSGCSPSCRWPTSHCGPETYASAWSPTSRSTPPIWRSCSSSSPDEPSSHPPLVVKDLT